MLESTIQCKRVLDILVKYWATFKIPGKLSTSVPLNFLEKSPLLSATEQFLLHKHREHIFRIFLDENNQHLFEHLLIVLLPFFAVRMERTHTQESCKSQDTEAPLSDGAYDLLVDEIQE